MQTRTHIAILLLAAGALGLGSAGYLAGGYGAVMNGPWRIWPSGVMPDQSPYVLAHFAARSALSPDTNQMAVFTATTDSDGNDLDGDCIYVISGTLPPARWWSLAVGDEASAVLSSGNVITGADGAFSAHAAAQAMPGNWLALSDSGDFELVLRFHGPTGLLKDNPQRATLPAIRKGECP
jgi:hypothetical protein